MKSCPGLIRQSAFLAVFILGICAVSHAQFVTVACDGFNYSAGSLSGQNGGTGWTGPWTNDYTPGASFQVSATGMSYPSLTNSGGSIVWGSGGNGLSEDSRTLPLQNSGIVYIQFLSQFGSDSGFGTPNIRLLNSGALTGGFGGNGGPYGDYVSILDNSLSAAADGSSSSSARPGISPNLVVARIDYQAHTTTMWVNPDLSTFNYQNPGTAPNATYAGLAPVFNAIYIVSRSPANVDEITILSAPGQTPSPVLNSPLSNSTNGNGVFISYTLPTTPLSGSVRLAFTNNLQTLTMVLSNATNASFVLSPHDPLASPYIVSTVPPSGTLPDGLYNVQLSYQDSNADPSASAIATNILVDTVTQLPSLLAPSNNIVVTSAGLHISYQLPETPAAGSVAITFYNSSTNVILHLSNNQTNDFFVPTGFLTGAAAVISATSSVLPDGLYDAQLSYQDASANPAASVIATNILVDTVTQPPSLLAPSNSIAITSAGLHISYQLPEVPAPGSVMIIFHNASTNIILHLDNSQTNDFVVSPVFLQGAAAVISATPSTLPDGRYTVFLDYQDALLNPIALIQVTNILVVVQPLYFYPTLLAYSNGVFQLEFSNNLPNSLGFNYNLMTSSNISTPLSNWVDLGSVTESPPGHFQFQETRPDNPAEFYILRVY